MSQSLRNRGVVTKERARNARIAHREVKQSTTHQSPPSRYSCAQELGVMPTRMTSSVRSHPPIGLDKSRRAQARAIAKVNIRGYQSQQTVCSAGHSGKVASTAQSSSRQVIGCEQPMMMNHAVGFGEMLFLFLVSTFVFIVMTILAGFLIVNSVFS